MFVGEWGVKKLQPQALRLNLWNMGYPLSLIPMKASKTNKVDVFCMRTWFVGLAIKPPKSSTFSSRNLNYSLLIESHDHDQSWRLQNGTTNISWYESYYYIASKQDKIMKFRDFSRVQMILYRESMNNAIFGPTENPCYSKPHYSSTLVIFDLKSVLFKDH